MKKEKKCRLAVFVSGEGTNLQALIDAIKIQEIWGEIVVIIADRKDIKAIKRAKAEKIDCKVILASKCEKEDFIAKRILNVLSYYKVDLVVLAGYMKILHSSVIKAYEKRILNIHPSLLPLYGGKGFYGHRVHRAVLEDKQKESGVTIHWVDEGVDTGQILYQEKVSIEKGETEDSLKEKIRILEHRALVEVVKSQCEIFRNQKKLW